MKKKRARWGTHQAVLLDTVDKVNKPVLELGCGIWSTVQIHDALKDRGIKILTVEPNPEWLSRYLHLKTELHDLRCVKNADMPGFYEQDDEQWGLVFIDNSTWWARKLAVQKYKDIADYIVLHDCDAILIDDNTLGENIKPINPRSRDTGIRDYSKTFKYWIEFFIENWGVGHPPTLLASNKICLDDIGGVDGMIISKRNE
jgi:hypothetical protein